MRVQAGVGNQEAARSKWGVDLAKPRDDKEERGGIVSNL